MRTYLFNDSTPPAPSGRVNINWQGPPGEPRDVSAYVWNLGAVDARTGTSETIALADQGKLVTFSNSSSVAVSLDSAVDDRFACAVQNLGTGLVVLTPTASATINGQANLDVTIGTGCWLFFDGTNWEAVLGGGTGSSFTASGDLTGTSTSQTVIGFDDIPLDLSSMGSPTGGNVIEYDSGLGKWKAAALSLGSFTASGDLTGTSTLQTVIGFDGVPLDLSSMGSPTGGVLIQYDSTTHQWKAVAQPYDIVLFWPGAMTNNATVLCFTMVRNVTLPASLTASKGSAGYAAAGSTTFSIRKNGTQFGTATFAAAATTCTFSAASSTSFVAGDVLTVLGPATADATLGDIAITLTGTR